MNKNVVLDEFEMWLLKRIGVFFWIWEEWGDDKLNIKVKKWF